MLAAIPIMKSRPQTLSTSTTSRTESQGMSRCTTGSSIAETKTNAHSRA